MSDNLWLDKLKGYFHDAFQVHEPDLEAARSFRRFEKGWLELVRNLLVVSALNFLAQKSDSRLLKGFAGATYFVLLAYVISFSNTFSIRFLPHIRNPRLNFLVNTILWLSMFLPLFFFLVISFSSAFDALNKVQH